MVVNVRTKDDLKKLLIARASGNWRIAASAEVHITKVRVFDWDNNQVLKGDFDRIQSKRDADNDLIIGMKKCRIENFYANESWFAIFNKASVVYTPYVPINSSNGVISGIVRDVNLVGMNQAEINDFFKRLIWEIRFRGLKRVVLRAGLNPIPSFFIDWCSINGVEIQILESDVLDRLYPVGNDVLWEDDLFDSNVETNERD